MKPGFLLRFNSRIGFYFNDGTGDGGGSSEGADPTPSPAEPAPPSGSAISEGHNPSFQESIPEKFRVFEGEGDEAQFNLEGSAKKLLDSYSALEKRGGAPESPEDYSLDGESIAEGFDFDEFKKENQAFLKSMHAAGLNNGQVQKVLEYGMKELIPGLMQGNQSLSQDDALNHMKTEVWKDGNEYAQNMTFSGRAYSSLSEELQAEVNNPDQPGGAIGNHPTFLKVMSLFGKEMGEDRPPAEETGMGDVVEIEKLMLSDAYRNPKNPDHEKVSRQVRAYFEKKNPAKAS